MIFTKAKDFTRLSYAEAMIESKKVQRVNLNGEWKWMFFDGQGQVYLPITCDPFYYIQKGRLTANPVNRPQYISPNTMTLKDWDVFDSHLAPIKEGGKEGDPAPVESPNIQVEPAKRKAGRPKRISK